MVLSYARLGARSAPVRVRVRLLGSSCQNGERLSLVAPSYHAHHSAGFDVGRGIRVQDHLIFCCL